ncbi:hypothetical protein MASR1M46_09160 [Bacteroidales bacterium]
MCRLLTLIISITLFATVADAEVRREYRELIPDSRVVINFPSEDEYKRERPVRLIIYALPNGNSIEETEGRSGELLPADWRYNIQHIAAQVRFLRVYDNRYNYVVAYLEASQKAWTSHAVKFNDSPALYKLLTDTIAEIVKSSLPAGIFSEKAFVTLASHSGGGRFVLNYIKSVEKIPLIIERISFIDSNYGYEEELHADKLFSWLNESKKNHLGVMAYVDTTVILDGKRIVSSRGGTGYRSRKMAEDLQKRGAGLYERRDTSFLRLFSENGQIQFWIKENPQGKIYHTILVERNGLVHQMLFNSKLEERDYVFWGSRCYGEYIR